MKARDLQAGPQAKSGPHAQLLFCDCKAKVIEAGSSEYDAKGVIERVLKESGAVLYQNTTKAITHFVIAQQSQVAEDDLSLLSQRIASAARVAPKAYIVSQTWVHECARLNQRVPEDQYRVEAENLPVALKKNHRRCKSTIPARADDVNLDLSAPFFSSTQVLQQADCSVPMARKQAYKSRRQPSALENMPRHSEPHDFSPATSVSKDDQLSQEHARMLYKNSRPAAHQHSKKHVTFSVERLPSRRRNTVHGHVPHSHTCSPPSMGRSQGLHVDFQLPHNLSPGSAVRARTRNRTPSLDFMLARIGMPLPIVREEGRALKRNEAMFLAAANASRASAVKSEIPIPVVRSVAEDEIAKQSCPSNRSRRRRTVVDPMPVDRFSSDGPAAKTPGEAIATGIWTEQRAWDHLPEYQPPASVATGGEQRRVLTERETSPRIATTPAGESSSGLVVPDSTYPTGAGEQATLRPPTAEMAGPSRTGAVRHDSDASAQENMVSPIEDTAAAEQQQDVGSARLPAGLFSCLAAMGHPTRNRLSALAAVVADSPDGDVHDHPVADDPDQMPSAAAGEPGESSPEPAEAPVLSRKRSVAARELGIVDFVADIGRSRQSNASNLSAVRRTRAGSSAAPSVSDTAAPEPPTGSLAGSPEQPHGRRRDTKTSIEPVLDVHVPRAKRSIRGGSVRRGGGAQKLRLQAAGNEPSRKRRKTAADAAASEEAVGAKVAVHDSAEEMESDSDFDMKTTREVQMRRQHVQAEMRTKPTNGKIPKTPNPMSSRKNGVVCNIDVQTDELPLALRAAGLETSWPGDQLAWRPAGGSGNMPPAKQRKRSEKGGCSKVRNVKAAANAGECDTGAGLCVACSGVAQDVLDRCRRAVSRLGNATMVDTEEEAMNSKLTHLVLGSNKRSGKLLLALASNAVVVRPDWLVQCIRWRRWVPTEEFLFEFGSHGDSSLQINQHAQSAVGTLLQRLKIHVAAAAANAKKGCVRVQLFRKLVKLLGGEEVAAGNCEVCILVSPEAQKKEQSSTQSSKQKGTGRTHRQKYACKNQVGVDKLGLPSDAVVVADSWLKSTVESRKKQPYTEHYL